MKLHIAWMGFLIVGSSANAADLGLSASSFKIRLYKFAVSTSPLCTNLTTVIDNGSAPVDTEMQGVANLGSGSLAKGTYPCVVIEMSDVLKYTPSTNSTSTNCVTTSEETSGICHNGDTSRKIDGTTTSCVTGSDDRIAIYISTGAGSLAADSFNPPLTVGDTSYGVPLGSPLVVNGATAATFVVDTAGQLCDDNGAGCDGSAGGTGTGGVGACKLEGATFTFE